MKRIILILTAILIVGCKSVKYNPVNLYPDTSVPFSRSLLMQNNENKNIDTFVFDNSTITIYNPYKNKGSLELKGSMHNHTSNSRDSLSADPTETAIKFRDEGGFDFYAFTDHDFVTFDPGVQDIIWMGNAVEDTRWTHHLNIYNLPTGYKFKRIGNDINVQVEYYRSIGGIVCYNHPDRSKGYQSNSKILSVNSVDFVEIYNHSIGSERAFDLLLSKGINVFCFGTDDYHNHPNKHINFNDGYIIVFAQEKERLSIWEAILSGSFYAAARNTRMNIDFNDGIITVSSNEPSTFDFIGLNTENPDQGRILHSVTDAQEATYRINGTEGYVRVKMSNPNGTAWSQAFVIM